MGTAYFGRKLTGALVTIVLIVLFNFFLFRMMPGSPERALARNPHIQREVLAATRARWGLDKPLFPDQFVGYVAATAQGDLGFSLEFRGQKVTDVLATHLWPTVILFGIGEILAAIIGLGLGAYTGWRRGGPIDRLGNGLSLILYSMPYFVIGMLMLVIFATGLGWFPTAGMRTLGAPPTGLGGTLLDFLAHFSLPLTTFTIGLICQYAILMRPTVIQTLVGHHVNSPPAHGLLEVTALRCI